MDIPLLTVNKVAMAVLLVFLLLLNKDNSEDLLAVLEILLLILQDNHHVLHNHLLHLLSAVLLDNLLHPQVVLLIKLPMVKDLEANMAQPPEVLRDLVADHRNNLMDRMLPDHMDKVPLEDNIAMLRMGRSLPFSISLSKGFVWINLLQLY